MKITINMPHQLEAETTIEDDTIMVKPRFRNASANALAAYITVSGKGRDERRFALSVSGRDGKLVLQEIKDEVTPLFDIPIVKRGDGNPTELELT